MEEKLKDLQKAACKSVGKLPLKPAQTRWSTKIYAMEVLLELRSYINLAMEEHPGKADWSTLAKASSCIPFRHEGRQKSKRLIGGGRTKRLIGKEERLID